MASVTTEMLMGTSVSFQASAEHIQHTACSQTYGEIACPAVPFDNATVC